MTLGLGRLPRALGVVAVVALLASAGVAATPDGETTTAADEDSTVVTQVDDDVRVLSYGFNSTRDVFSVELENTGSSSTSVTLTEAISRKDAGSGSFGVEVVDIDGGETVTVRVDMRTSNSRPGVMIVSSQSVEQGHGSFLSAKKQDDGGLFRGPATWNDVRVGIGAGIGGTAAVFFIAAWHVVASRNEDVNEVTVE